jgi:tRNA(Arg) A34 adenosine deaminase TadA
VTPDDEQFLRRAIALAAHARATGDAPYGSLLVGQGGDVLAEAHNTVLSDADISAHPELKLARWAARELDRETAAGTTMYTSCEPCGMCTGAIERAFLKGVVFAMSGAQLATVKAPTAPPTAVQVPQDGPLLFDEAAVPLAGYYA